MFSRKKDPGDVVAIADIGSDSVGICIANLRGSSATILWSDRQVLPFEERTLERTQDAILELLRSAADNAAREWSALSGGPVLECWAVLGPPWCKTAAVRAAVAFDKEERITERIIGSLAREAFAHQTELDTQDIFEAAVVSVELNGYPTERPEGKVARGAFVSAILSEADGALRTGISEALTRAFLRPTALRSGSRAIVFVVRESGVSSRNHTIIHIGGAASSCIVVRKDVFAEHILIREGTRSIVKRISGQNLPEETLSLLRMMERDACESGVCDALLSSMAAAEPELAKIFGEAFAKIASRHRLPNDLIVIVIPELSSWMLRFLSRIDFAQFTITTQPFNTRELQPQHVSLESMGERSDLGLLLSTQFVNRERDDR